MGRETPLNKLSEWTWDEVAEYPLVWRNPGVGSAGRPHLQVHGCCVYRLTTKDPKTGAVSVIDDVQKVRDICYAMQKKIYAAENIYAHRWQEGDLVIFHNKGVMHSITGQLNNNQEDEQKKRLLWQCTMGSTERPQAFRD
jgi:alpha-ketoglutarate-dependent taurine dioxygenase